MIVKCKHCGNEQEYNVRSGKIPQRPKTTCNNSECKKEIYINKNLLMEMEMTEVERAVMEMTEAEMTEINIVENKESENSEISIIKPKSIKPIKRVKISTEKIFIEDHKDTLLDALYNAINTIKNKKEVISEDLSKKYYRDFLRYNKTLEELLKKDKE